MMQLSSLADLGADFGRRFGPLLEGLAQSARAREQPKEPALVPAVRAGTLLDCLSLFAGKDAEIVLVRAKRDLGGKAQGVKETLTYRRDIEGSDLVYDLTGEFMQGKARPFDCDLRKQPARLYALLPFQVENLAVMATQEPGKVLLKIEFQNGLGQRVAGALPCHAELRRPDGKISWERFLATSAEGTLTAVAELPPEAPVGKWSLVVRSLLDGRKVALPLVADSRIGK